MRLPAQVLFSLGVVLGLGALVAGCSDGSSSRTGKQVLPPAPRFVAVLHDYTERPLENVPLQLLGATTGARSRIDGLAALGANPVGAQVLRYGDSVDTPTLLLPYTQAPLSNFHPMPLYLPDLESGVANALPDGPVVGTVVISGDNMPGVSLDVTGTTVTGSTGTVRVIGVSPSRLPLPVSASVPAAAEPRAAFLVENHGVQFAPAAQLTLPLLDTVNATFDVYKVNRTTGQWELDTAGIVPAGGPITFPVDEGTLYAVVPQVAQTTVTVTGRVVAGTTPIAGYLVSCWNVSEDAANPGQPARTAADGTFQIANVPDTFSAYLVRAIPDNVGLSYAPEVVSVVSTTPNLSVDLTVAARVPDLIEPEVRATNPADNATNVSRSTQVVVTFSEPIDTDNRRPFRLLGPTGPVDGQISYDNGFTARFRPLVNLDPTADYNILIDRDVRDLAGNRLDDSFINFRFRTRGGAPTAPPTDTQAFGLDPLVAVRGDTIDIPGRNYTGGTTVTFGGTQGTVSFEASDIVQALVPDYEPAGNRTVGLSAGGTAIGTLQPLVLDLRATSETIYDDTSLTTPLPFVDRAAPPTDIVVAGFNTGGTTVTIDGVAISAADLLQMVGGSNVAVGRQITLTTPAPATLLTGPVVLRGSNGEPASTYRFLQVRD